MIGMPSILTERWEIFVCEWKKNVLVSLVLAAFSVASLPIDMAHGIWRRCWSRLLKSDLDNIIDAWHVCSLATWLAFLLLLGPRLVDSPWRYILLFPLVRVADLFYTLMLFAIRRQLPQDTTRAFLLSLVHYAELVVIFACAYGAFFRSDCAGCLVALQSPPLPTEFLYFSVVTATTVGYGDIHPVIQKGCEATLWLVILQPMIFLLVTALLIPRAVAKFLNVGDPKPTTTTPESA